MSKLVRDKFKSPDGLVHYERGFAVYVTALCERFFLPKTLEWLPDEARVSCLGCLSEEGGR